MSHKFINVPTIGYVIWRRTDIVTHADMARFITKEIRDKSVTSAGFVKFESGGPVCYGRSESLNIGCDTEEDSRLMAEQLGMWS